MAIWKVFKQRWMHPGRWHGFGKDGINKHLSHIFENSWFDPKGPYCSSSHAHWILGCRSQKMDTCWPQSSCDKFVWSQASQIKNDKPNHKPKVHMCHIFWIIQKRFGRPPNKYEVGCHDHWWRPQSQKCKNPIEKSSENYEGANSKDRFDWNTSPK